MDSKALSEVSACEYVSDIDGACGYQSQVIKKIDEAIKAIYFGAVLIFRVPPEEVGKALKKATEFLVLPVEEKLDSDEPLNAVTLVNPSAFESSRKGKHSYNKGPSEASDEGGAFRVPASDYKSNFVGSDLDRIRKDYEVPNDFRLAVPDFGDGVCLVKKGDTVLYEASFKAGLRLPFHPFIGKLLHRLGLAPGQLTPNAWRIVLGSLKLWRSCYGGSAKLSVDEFLYCYKLVAVPKPSSHWHFVARNKDTKLVPKLPSSNGSWKNNYFIVHGDGDALSEGVNCSWGDPNQSVLDRPNLDDFHLNRVKMAVTFSRRDNNSLVTPQNLVPLSGDAEKSNQKRMNTKIQSQKKAKLPILGKRKASSELQLQESSAHGVTPPVIGPTTSSVEDILPLTLRPSKGKEVAITPTIDTDGALETVRFKQVLTEQDVTVEFARMIRILSHMVDEAKKNLAKHSETDNEDLERAGDRH